MTSENHESGDNGGLSHSLIEAEVCANTAPENGNCSAHSDGACAYCGMHAGASVVKCEICDKWFCNSKGRIAASHIVSHLVSSKHNRVSLGEASPLGAEMLECYNCGNQNVFVLGFVAAKHESVVVILCRSPCALQRDINWDINDWQPLLENRALLSWVAPVPTPEQMEQVTPITDSQAKMLERKWRTDQKASLADLDSAKDSKKELLPVPLRFSGDNAYHNSWVPLIEAEAENDRELKESQAAEQVKVTWTKSNTGDNLAQFTLQNYETSKLMVAIGDSIKLHYRPLGSSTGDSNWEGEAIIVSRPGAKDDFFTASFSRGMSVPSDIIGVYSIEFMWVGVPYTRMIQAIEEFATNSSSVSAYLYHTILGHQTMDVQFNTPIPKDLSIPGMASLNESQYKALRMAIKNPLSLIQGPPGTGKTVTSSAIIYQLSKLQKNRILVCAPSNVAVDHVAAKLHKLGLKVVRVFSKSREEVEKSSIPYDIRVLVKEKLKSISALLKKKEAGEFLKQEEYKQLKIAIQKAEKKVLHGAEVVCCTCVGASDYRIKGRFNTVLIDESTQALETEAIVPLVKGCKQLILVGDHQQLGPVVIDDEAGKCGLSQSLYERLIALGHVPHRLETQYRMNPALAEFSSNMFYEGTLQNGVSAVDRTWPKSTFPWPVPSTPMMFWVNYGKEEISSNGSSYLNRVEAMNVERVITRLFNDGIKPHQIGVITPYEGQRAYISQYMTMNTSVVEKRAQYEEVEVLSVDSFQGREKDFIILSCVRGNEGNKIGFLRDPRRLNVALTRAKFGMVVLGNPTSLSKDNLWNRLLVHYREKGCLVEGPLDNLQLSLVQLSAAKRNDPAGTRDASARDIVPDDLQSMLSHAPGSETSKNQMPDGEAWPALTRNQVTALNEKVGVESNAPKLEDMASFVDAFSSSLNV